MKKYIKSRKTRAVQAFRAAGKAAITGVGAVGSSVALAIDDTAVTAAYTAGQTSADNATTGLIALIAVIVGVGIVISLLKKA